MDDDDVQVSDVLDVFQKLKRGAVTTNNEAVPNEAAAKYITEAKGQNILDPWQLAALLESATEAVRETTQKLGDVLVVAGSSLNEDKTAEAALLQCLFAAVDTATHVVVEMPLDASINGSVDTDNDINVDLSEMPLSECVRACASENDDESGNAAVWSATERYGRQLVDSYLRLIINSRDELALARVIAGPAGVLGHEAFTLLKKESAKCRMPLYQV